MGGKYYMARDNKEPKKPVSPEPRKPEPEKPIPPEPEPDKIVAFRKGVGKASKTEKDKQ